MATYCISDIHGEYNYHDFPLTKHTYYKVKLDNIH